MRDRDENSLEFIDAFEKDDHFFAIVQFHRRRFQFGVSRGGYLAIKRAMQVRPFDLMPGVKYRYFYSGSCKAAVDGNQYKMDVRVEMDRNATTESLEIPRDLHANLLWFIRLENISEASYLEIH